MVSYYNSLAMFPNRHAPQSTSPAAAAAAAAAAYLGYHGYHHPHHPHHHHHHAPHHHVHPQASSPAAPTATHHQSPHHHLHHNIGHHLAHQYPVENHDIGGGGGGGGHGGTPMGGTGMNHLAGHQHHQYAPPTPPSQYDHNPHHHLSHHLLQHHVHTHSEGDGQASSPHPLGTTPSWHSPVYPTSSCARSGGGSTESASGMTGGSVYEGWSPQPPAPMQPSVGSLTAATVQQGSPPPPSSVTPDYKIAPGLDFSIGASPTMMGMSSQQPQDLSNGSAPSAAPLTGVSLPLAGTTLPPQHASPDSGLAGSSDGVSSSAGSPQHIHQLQHQHQGHIPIGQQGSGMQMPMQQSQQTLLQVATNELPRQVPQQQHQSHHHQQGDHQQQQQQQPRPQPVRSPYEWMKKPSYQNQPNPVDACMTYPCLVDGQTTDLPGKTRTKDKYRVVYSDRQRLELEKEFHYSRYITIRRKSELATALGLSDRQVKIWFQNRRAKERKHLKKREEVAHKDKMDPEGNGNSQQPRDQTQIPHSDQMPSDLIPIPNQLHVASHPLQAQHLHHHHPHQHHAEMNEPPPQQQQQPSMVLPLTSVTIGGVDL